MIILLIVSLLLNIFFVIQCVLISREYDKYNARFKAQLEDIKAEIENIDLVYEKNGRTTIMKNFDDIKSEIFDILDKHIKENKQ